MTGDALARMKATQIRLAEENKPLREAKKRSENLDLILLAENALANSNPAPRPPASRIPVPRPKPPAYNPTAAPTPLDERYASRERIYALERRVMKLEDATEDEEHKPKRMRLDIDHQDGQLQDLRNEHNSAVADLVSLSSKYNALLSKYNALSTSYTTLQTSTTTDILELRAEIDALKSNK